MIAGYFSRHILVAYDPRPISPPAPPSPHLIDLSQSRTVLPRRGPTFLISCAKTPVVRRQPKLSSLPAAFPLAEQRAFNRFRRLFQRTVASITGPASRTTPLIIYGVNLRIPPCALRRMANRHPDHWFVGNVAGKGSLFSLKHSAT